MAIVLNDITKQIKGGKHFKLNLNINAIFEQTNSIPKRNGEYISLEEIELTSDTNEYEEGDIIDIPCNLTNICNLDNYYILGVSHRYNLLEAIFYNLDDKFKFENESKKNLILNEFKDLLKNKFPKKSDMIFNDKYSNEYINMCADYFNINILCIDCTNNSYHIYKELNSDDKIIVLVKMYSKYLPLLHVFGETPNYSLCSIILKYFNDK